MFLDISEIILQAFVFLLLLLFVSLCRVLVFLVEAQVSVEIDVWKLWEFGCFVIYWLSLNFKCWVHRYSIGKFKKDE